MVGLRVFNSIVLATILAMLVSPPLSEPVDAAGEVNVVVNPDFEVSTSRAWFSSSYGNGTVRVYDNANPHEGSYSAMLNATKTTVTCPPSTSECKDAVRGTVEQYVPFNSPTLDSLANTPDSFSSWWYVVDPATSGMQTTYSVHIGIGFSDGSSIEYWYGTSDLANQRHNLGAIPSIGSWFQMRRDLLTDIQPLNIAYPSGTRVSYVWFAAFGNITRGEIAWVDDVAVMFENPSPGGAMLTNPNPGGPLFAAGIAGLLLLLGIFLFRKRLLGSRRSRGSKLGRKRRG